MQSKPKRFQIPVGMLLLAISSAAMTCGAAYGVDAKAPVPAAKAAPGAKTPPSGYRKKELNFEERVIEGLSNRGYESLSQTGTSDALKGEKLYRKRAEFDEDSKSLLREMEYLK